MRKNKEPLKPEELKRFLALRAEKYEREGIVASHGQRGLVRGMLAELAGGEEVDYRVLLEFLTGVRSSKSLSYGQVLAFLDWIDATRPDDPDGVEPYEPHPLAKQEAIAVIREGLVASGQPSFLSER